MVKFIVGLDVTTGAVDKTTGIPFYKDGTTAGRAKWPFPSIQAGRLLRECTRPTLCSEEPSPRVLVCMSAHPECKVVD